MLDMPASAATPARRLLLVPAGPRRSDDTLRRFRLARVTLAGRDPSRAERFVNARREPV
jgi:hypothetical protein